MGSVIYYYAESQEWRFSNIIFWERHGDLAFDLAGDDLSIKSEGLKIIFIYFIIFVETDPTKLPIEWRYRIRNDASVRGSRDLFGTALVKITSGDNFSR